MSLFENYDFGSINVYVHIYNLDFRKMKVKVEEGKFDTSLQQMFIQGRCKPV